MTTETPALEQRVQEISFQIQSTTDPQALIPNLIQDLKGLFPCEAVTLYSLDRASKQLVSCHPVTLDASEFRINLKADSLIGYAIINGKPILLKDAGNAASILTINPRIRIESTIDDALSIQTRSLMILPLPHNKKVVGIIEFVNKSGKGEFSEQDFKFAKELAPFLGLLVTNLDGDRTMTARNSSTMDTPASKPLSSAELQEKLVKIINDIHSAKNVDEILISLKERILELFDATLITIYAVDLVRNEVYSKIKSGDKINEIRLPIAPQSIAGCVAMEQRMAVIKNVYDDRELKKFHPELTFDSSWDKISGFHTKSMLVTPLIHKDKMMGVMQLINKKSSQSFNVIDEKNAKIVAETLALAFYNQSKFVQQKPTRFSYLLQQGLLTDIELNKSINRARKEQIDIENILIDELGISRKELGKSLENFYKIPYMGYEDGMVLPATIFEGLNLNFLSKNHWVPVEREDNNVVIVIDNPNNLDKIQNIKLIFVKKQIEFKVGLKADIRDFLNSAVAEDSSGAPLEEMSILLNALESEKETELTSDESEDGNAISESDNTIVKLVNKILTDAYDNGVSDIHIEPGLGKDHMIVRFRKDGACRIYQEIPPMYKFALMSRLKIMARLDIAEKRLPQDGKIKLKYGGKDVEYRLATCPTVGGNEDAVLRILAASKPIPLENMNFSDRNIALVKSMASKPYGLILVVGPTGSGKTTTLHSTLGFINTPEKKIWTAEDPVEITQKGLRQVQMLNKIGLDFARAMRSFLRGDPDVIMVGEMRDAETCAIGLEASLTGHLVFSTLHTNSAPETITRLLDMGMNPLNFADALLCIVAQRLVRTLCKNCKEPYHPSKEEYDTLVHEYGDPDMFAKNVNIPYTDDLMLNGPKGCDKCNDTGYAGRTGLHECLEGTAETKRLVMKQALVEELREQGIKDGMTTLKQDGIWKVFKGDCDLKQVLAVCIV
ncbi:GspE/PulE family protein [Nitrospina watsonii]|uniref:Type II secretory pathway, ATPase PulE/Tfp pilus assembly pathway, ATPase PilB n=1 Tax=Nitrospina watsonii TaxID=1323948 RepID=A0ABN8VWP2_9BACT|nr:GspE/PulE family protein [Nitrospina watsonii]CAI2718199.1 Type II secretory pathway, ATPase PulE/Tfp pilus assembly pathway, ATPase PilB [Nitrospina watsonii]